MAAPSSNSSPAEPSSPAFILDSLETLRREYPYVYDRMCAALAPRSLRLTIDGQSLPLRFEPGRHLSPDQLPEPDVRLATSRQTILEVIDCGLGKLLASRRVDAAIEGFLGLGPSERAYSSRVDSEGNYLMDVWHLHLSP